MVYSEKTFDTRICIYSFSNHRQIIQPFDSPHLGKPSSGPCGYPRVLATRFLKLLLVPYSKNFTTRPSSEQYIQTSFFQEFQYPESGNATLLQCKSSQATTKIKFIVKLIRKSKSQATVDKVSYIFMSKFKTSFSKQIQILDPN